MYIGALNDIAKATFCFGGTNKPLAPDRVCDGVYSWSWNKIFDSTLDITYTLEKECYIGAIEMAVSGVVEISASVDGTPTKISAEGLSIIGLSGRYLKLSLRGKLENITVSDVTIFGAYDDGHELIFPTVKNALFGEGRVKISGITAANGEDCTYAANFLREAIGERHGNILSADGAAVKLAVAKNGYENERYTIDVGTRQIAITAGNRLNLLHAACVLCGLISGGTLPVVSIDETPDVPMRGFHMGLPRRDRFDFAKKLFKYILLPLGYNHVILEFNGAMRYDSHPEIGEKWLEAADRYAKGLQPRMPHSEMGADGTLLEKEDVKELVDYIKELGFEVIPEVQSFGHVQYLTYAHPEIAEIEEKAKIVDDRRAEDERPSEFYHHAYCPSKKQSLEIIRDLINEVLEVVRPERYLHIGHDEVYQIGLCPTCRKKKKTDIFRDHILALYEYAKKRNLKIMMWSDMLHGELLPYSCETAEALTDIPKDIVFLDFTWYFNFSTDIEDSLLPNGNQVMMGNLYSSHYPRYSTRIKKPGMIGGEVSTWVAVSEEDYADNGKFFDLCCTAQMLRRASSYDERAMTTYRHIVAHNIQQKQRDAMHGKLDTGATLTHLGNIKGDRSLLPRALSLAVPEAVIPESEPMEIGGCYSRLVFEHATLHSAPRIAWQPLKTVGSYVVSYADGETVRIPIRYAGDVLSWNSVYAKPLPQQYYRHQGYIGTWYADPVLEGRTAEGSDLLFCGMVFENPYPEKIISSVAYEANAEDICTLVIKGVKGIK